MKPPANQRSQQGAVAIEFAVIFGIFFVVLYSIIAYCIPMLLLLTFKQVSADAARYAMQVDPATTEQAYKQFLSNAITEKVEQSWLPRNWRDGNCAAPEPTDLIWEALPGSNGQPSYGHIALGSTQPEDQRYILHVCLQRKYNKTGGENERAILPVLELFGISIPSLPKEGGDTLIKGSTLLRL